MSKIDLDKFIASLIGEYDSDASIELEGIHEALEEQGLKYANGEIVEIAHEPKFKVGDWVINKSFGNVKQIKEFDNDEKVWFTDGSGTFIEFLNGYRLWTIQDAKVGDVLSASDGSLFIFGGLRDKAAYFHISLCKNGSMEISDGKHCWETATACNPATKEQRDLLFQKMKEAGYEWDADALKLKKIPKVGNVVKCTSTGSLWLRRKEDNIRSDGHSACIGGGWEVASEEETKQFFAELKANGYEWDADKLELRKIDNKEYQPRVADYEDFREWKDDEQDPILQMLDKILEALTEIKINTVLRQPYIETYPPYPYPIQPWYDTNKVWCSQASTNTKKQDDGND